MPKTRVFGPGFRSFAQDSHPHTRLTECEGGSEGYRITFLLSYTLDSGREGGRGEHVFLTKCELEILSLLSRTLGAELDRAAWLELLNGQCRGHFWVVVDGHRTRLPGDGFVQVVM